MHLMKRNSDQIIKLSSVLAVALCVPSVVLVLGCAFGNGGPPESGAGGDVPAPPVAAQTNAGEIILTFNQGDKVLSISRKLSIAPDRLSVERPVTFSQIPSELEIKLPRSANLPNLQNLKSCRASASNQKEMTMLPCELRESARTGSEGTSEASAITFTLSRFKDLLSHAAENIVQVKIVLIASEMKMIEITLRTIPDELQTKVFSVACENPHPHPEELFPLIQAGVDTRPLRLVHVWRILGHRSDDLELKLPTELKGTVERKMVVTWDGPASCVGLPDPQRSIERTEVTTSLYLLPQSPKLKDTWQETIADKSQTISLPLGQYVDIGIYTADGTVSGSLNKAKLPGWVVSEDDDPHSCHTPDHDVSRVKANLRKQELSPELVYEMKTDLMLRYQADIDVPDLSPLAVKKLWDSGLEAGFSCVSQELDQ